MYKFTALLNFIFMKNPICFLLFFSLGYVVNLTSQTTDVGLLGYYPFNNTATDRSGNCNVGQVYNAQPTTDRFGNINSAYHFDGTIDQYIEIPADNFVTPNYSYSVWAYAETLPITGEFQTLISIGGELWQDQGIALRDGGYGGASYNSDGSNFVLNSKTSTQLNKWVHLVLTRSDDDVKFYQDGELVDNVPNSQSLTPFYSKFPKAFLGLRHNFTKGFLGKIDDVRIYNRAISQDEVTQLYNENVCFLNISVSDTLVINAHLTSLFPVNYKINIKAYPNPTLDHLIIDAGNISDLKDYSMKIRNATGIEVFQSAIDKQFYDLDMNKWLGKGLYLLYLYDSNLKIVDVKKLILQ